MDSVRTSIRDQIPALRRYARALVGDRDRADDLVQDCLVRAINAEAQWKPGTNLRAWLFTILHNVYVSEWRKRAHRPALVPIESEAWRLEAPASQLSKVQIGELERALARLPEPQRMTVLLIGLHGMDYQETAAIMEVPLGTVRSRLSRARRALLLRLGILSEAGASDTSPWEANGVATGAADGARLPAAQARRSA